MNPKAVALIVLGVIIAVTIVALLVAYWIGQQPVRKRELRKAKADRDRAVGFLWNLREEIEQVDDGSPAVTAIQGSVRNFLRAHHYPSSKEIN